MAVGNDGESNGIGRTPRVLCERGEGFSGVRVAV